MIYVAMEESQINLYINNMYCACLLEHAPWSDKLVSFSFLIMICPSDAVNQKREHPDVSDQNYKSHLPQFTAIPMIHPE